MKRQSPDIVPLFAEVAREVRVWRELAGSQTVQLDYTPPYFCPVRTIPAVSRTGNRHPNTSNSAPAGF